LCSWCRARRKRWSSDNLDYWIGAIFPVSAGAGDRPRCRSGTGNNRAIVNQIVQRLNCQVGGGIRSLENARDALEAGARRGRSLVSALFERRKDQHAVRCQRWPVPSASAALVFALDSRGGRVAIDGWRKDTAVYRVRHDSCARTILRNLSLHSHRYRRVLMGGIPMGNLWEQSGEPLRGGWWSPVELRHNRKSTVSTRWGWMLSSGWLLY